jgi:hypothetical protein
LDTLKHLKEDRDEQRSVLSADERADCSQPEPEDAASAVHAEFDEWYFIFRLKQQSQAVSSPTSL